VTESEKCGILGDFDSGSSKTIKAGCGCCRLFGLRWKHQRWLQGLRCGYFNPDNAVAVVDGVVRSILKDLNLMTLSSR